MAFTLVGWAESIDPAGIFENLAALPDQHVTTSGDDVRVPRWNQIVAAAALAENTVAPRARLVSPSLRRRTNLFIAPLNVAAAGAVEPGSPHAIADYRGQEISLDIGENLNAQVLSNPAAAQIQSAFAWLADAPIARATGKIFSVRATSTATLVASTWSNSAISFDETLPAGRYQVVGFRPMSAGLLAARMVFVGQGQRPGALGTDVISDIESQLFRSGNLGVWGEFEHDQPPTVDWCSASADTAEEAIIDLIQVRDGVPPANA